ncbi:beta strand repeat-containing protein [Candidatus Nitrosotenuis chungbukensis]|uniref:beta strand repeat-containing protein n=1 Tax=Candidatus Nitrosotenuis chungbukensis TaxID=1353246 RepID=UPI0005B2CA95|nr:hypothetical protein [Candidatus Nitrosotenuis chungbukensis]
MNNEIGRKITSLTLMTIMLAAGFSAFAPSAMPQAAAANANLYVSAENSQFQNYFAGPQVIEVVVIDSDIKDTNEGKGEPDVTINGNKLRMVQATDGNWYGYFADKAQAQKADATAKGSGASTTRGTGLDFGNFCKNDSTVFGPSFSQTVGIAVATNATGGTDGESAFTTCTAVTGSSGTGVNLNNVVRENKTVNRGVSTSLGQIGLTSIATDKAWPIIQLYDFSAGGSVVVQYNKGGGIQKTTLTFDTIPSNMIGVTLDRSNFPQSSQVHATMTDPQLNIDPTDEDSWTFGTLAGNATIFYQLFDENGARAGDGLVSNALTGNLTGLMFESNGLLKVNGDVQSSGTPVLLIQDNADSVVGPSGSTLATAGTSTVTSGNQPVTFTEQSPNSGIFGTYDETDTSVLKVTSNALRGTSASLQYNSQSDSIVVAQFFGTLNFDEAALGGEWNSGEEIAITLVDGDQNLNTRADEDLDLYNANVTLPAIKIGSPLTLSGVGSGDVAIGTSNAASATGGITPTVDTYSDRLKIITSAAYTTTSKIFINVTTNYTQDDFSNFIRNASRVNGGNGNGMFNYFQYDLRSLSNALSGASIQSITVGNASAPRTFVFSATTTTDFSSSDFQNMIDMGKGFGNLTDSKFGGTDEIKFGINITTTSTDRTLEAGTYPITLDFLRFGISDDGVESSERFNDAIYRLELEETGDNTATFAGTVEYIMLNQLNVNQTSTYKGIASIDDEIRMIVGEDLTDEDSVRANFLDVGADGIATQIADQVEAPTHSGVVSFDMSNYKVGDTVTITLQDQDLNTDTDLIDIYTVVTSGNDKAYDTVGKAGYGVDSQGDLRGRLLDVTFDDERWLSSSQTGSGTLTCSTTPTGSNGLGASGFTLVEQGSSTGIFQGSFQIPSQYCARNSGTGTIVTTQGTDIEVNYLDFRDASGEVVETGDGAGIRSNTGSVSLDRTVYPLPWGQIADLSGSTTGSTSANSKSVFPIHATGLTGNVDSAAETLGNGDITLHIQVNDPDFNTSASGEDKIQETGDVTAHGPVKVVVSRGSSSMVLASAGASASTGNNGKITVGTDTVDNSGYVTRELGPITETAPDSGIFEFDLVVRYTDGPASSTCPTTTNFVSANNSTRFANELARFDTSSGSSAEYCLLQGDIVTVTYRDPADSSGQPNTITDSATFDLRNGAIQSDKSVYIIGSDMILTVIEPDFDRDNDSAETYDLDLLEWDSDAATVTMGDLGGEAAAFDPEPASLRETGDSTGIFQTVIEIPSTLGGDKLERGEEIVLEYTDWGPSGADYVGQESEDVNLTIFTSNFGATVELDQKVYTWTDKVYITIIAPDHNFDSNLIDTIGDTTDDPVKVATRGHKLDEYHLTESGVDTGIFTGEVILTGFAHDADGDASTGTNGNDAPNFTGQSSSSSVTTDLGPTNGYLQADDDDGLTVSFEFSEDETIVGSALVRWNIGEVAWLEASYPASGTGVVRIIDPDMNLNPEAINNFNADVWSDSDAGGIDLTVTETNEASGIFEGTVYFTTTDESSGHRLRVAEGDTVTAEYQDNTLPSPYTRSDELDITGTAFIGTVVPPLERAPASNARVVDAFGNSLDEVSVDQQVQITADLVNGQDREQPFAYLVQIQDENGVTVSLAWITGSLSAGQSFSPALSWIPTTSGTYTATVFVWESVDNPTALSPPVSVDINVS